MRRCVVILFVLVFCGCAAKIYTEEQLRTLGAEYVEGVVSKQSLGSFLLKQDEKGEAVHFRTGEQTQYIPENYRSLEGDTVGVTYIKQITSVGGNRYVALQLKSIAIPEQNQPIKNPVTAKVLGVRKGSYKYSKALLLRPADTNTEILVYVGAKSLIYDRDTKSYTAFFGEGLEIYVDKTVKCEVHREPVVRGNGSLYVLDRLALAE